MQTKLDMLQMDLEDQEEGMGEIQEKSGKLEEIINKLKETLENKDSDMKTVDIVFKLDVVSSCSCPNCSLSCNIS
jgi:predicted transcriptional regulator